MAISMGAFWHMKKLSIIARYNEDISWAKSLESDIFIYNKGENWDWDDIPRADIPNYGRESETYVRAILEFYDLLDEYSVVAFLQGNPFDHYDFPVESINNCQSHMIQFLANSLVSYNYDQLYYYFGKSNLLISKLFYPDFKFQANMSNFINENKNENPNHTRGNEIATTLLFSYLLDLKTYSNGILYPAGAQYIIPTKYIKNKSLSWWEEFYKLIIDWQKIVPGDDIGAYCERTWPLIWAHESKSTSSKQDSSMNSELNSDSISSISKS